MRRTPSQCRSACRHRQRFRRRLLTWYREHGRDLPWRTTDDPYHILVSEIMLQQTQVDRVLPKYHEWLDKYPSLAALASAADDEVADTWRPLGYNIRPAAAAVDRARIGRCDTAASCRRTRRRCCRSRASARTRPAPSAASRSVSGPRFSTPTSRACSTACSSAVATSRRTRCASGCGASPRRSCRTSTSSTSIRR